jgi:hypothetical protein
VNRATLQKDLCAINGGDSNKLTCNLKGTPMLTTVIMLLIQLCILALCIYVILWVLEIIGIVLPPKVIQILWVIICLVALYLIVQTLLPIAGGRHLLG